MGFLLPSIIFSILIFQSGGLQKLRKSAQIGVDRTVYFTNVIREISEKIRNYENCTITFYTNNPMDYEPIFSIKEYLDSFGLDDHPYNVKPYFCGKKAPDALQESLIKSICEWETNGMGDTFVSFDKSEKNRCCI